MIFYTNTDNLEEKLDKMDTDCISLYIYDKEKDMDISSIIYRNIHKINNISIIIPESGNYLDPLYKMIAFDRYLKKEEVSFDFGEMTNTVLSKMLDTLTLEDATVKPDTLEEKTDFSEYMPKPQMEETPEEKEVPEKSVEAENPEPKKKKEYTTYSTDFKKALVKEWVQKGRPNKRQFSMSKNIGAMTFGNWVKRYESEVQVEEDQLQSMDMSDISYYDENGYQIPYYYDIDLHEELLQEIKKQGISLEQMEVCVIEKIALTCGKKVLYDDTFTYEDVSYEDFFNHIMKYEISERIKNNLPENVIRTIFLIRERFINKR